MARQATRLRAQRPLPGAPTSLACAVGSPAAVTPHISPDSRRRSPEALCDPPYRPTGGNATRDLFALLKPQRYRSSPAWRWSNSSIESQDPIDAALVPPLKRSGDVRHTLTALPALPELSLLLRREPCPCVPLHTHTSSSGKIRRCCVDRLNSLPKADVTTINVSMLCRCGTVGQLHEPYPSRGRWISSQFSRTPATLALFISRSARLRAPRTCRRRRPLSRERRCRGGSLFSQLILWRSMNDPREVRRAVRHGEHSGHTAGLAPGYVQGNVCILPREYAEEFALFCERNPKPCPLLAASQPGEAQLPSLGKDLDIRTDVPRYRVFRNGERVEDVGDIRALWREDLVAFVLGCSFSFEQALLEAGLRLRYLEEGKNVPMYRTSIDTAPAGRFRGKLVVSMRPFKPADAIRAIEITSRYPRVHGAPVHLGRPDLIGIEDLARPWAGDPTEVREDELPLFWACGITPQSVLLDARPSLCITHAPGHMLVTDLTNASLASP